MEISNQFNELIGLIELKKWWFANSNIWFDSTESDDIYISSNYEYLLSMIFDEEYIIKDKELGIGYIILYDQITRHIARAKKYNDSYITDKLNKILEFVRNFYIIYNNDLEGYEFCFVLLPLRHTNQFENQTFVMDETWNKIVNASTNTFIQSDISRVVDSKIETLVRIYKKYLKATYERSTNGQVYLDKHESNNDNFDEILDTRCLKYLVNPLEEKNNIVVKIEKVCEYLKNNSKYILSISGGVDSMVLANILCKLNVDFVLVHINYANRGEMCEKEKKMLSNWANINNVELYIRDIYEITRPKCMKYDLRNLYEDYTKNVRYQSYIDVAKIKKWEKSNWCVLLGHNHDDCIENILTNIANKSKYDNLMGMEHYTEIKFKNNTINFVRPLLTIPKEIIYEYASNNGIYYLIDSTPKWSQRGKIRDIIRPALIEWNQSSLAGFEELADMMKESLECVNLLVSNWINKIQPYDALDDREQIILVDKSKTKMNVIKINIQETKTNKIFWSKLLDRIGYRISLKSLNELINKINIIRTKFDTMQIKQLSKIPINKNNMVYWWKINASDIIFGFE